MKVSLSWLKDYVDVRIRVEELAERLTMAGLEVTSIYKFGREVIFDIEVTPNRTDCLSIIGVAREVAAITKKKLKLPKAVIRSPQAISRKTKGVKIEIKDKQGCLRYVGRMIVKLNIVSSPLWLKSRLNALGVRAINNVVDITNYCLLELGQPLHAFDYDKLEGAKITIRRAVKGEEITTIDGVRRELDKGILVIADKFKPVAIAGIMGGKDTEVTGKTKRILLESAYFDPVTIRKASKHLGLVTESSYRFERGVNWENVFFASQRAAELIVQFAGGKEKAVKEAPGLKRQKKAIVINLPLNLVNDTLGTSLSENKVKGILKALQFTVRRGKLKDELRVITPFFRQDITRAIDLVEEIARIYGYEQIPTTIPKATFHSSLFPFQRKIKIENKIRNILTGLGFNEVVSFSLISRNLLTKINLTEAEAIAVENPLSYEQEIMRPTLIPGLLDIIAWNLNRRAERIKIFELSSVYLKTQDRFIEREHLAFAISGRVFENWVCRVKIEADFFDLKGCLERLLERLGIEEYEFKSTESPYLWPGKAAGLILKGEGEIGLLGAIKREILEEFDISNDVYVCEIKIGKMLSRITKERKFHKISKQPSISRDIALIVRNEIPSKEIVSIIEKKGRGIVNKVKFFDQYLGEQIPPGFRSLAYSIEYQAEERTLEDKEVNEIHSLICKELSEKLKAQIR